MNKILEAALNDCRVALLTGHPVQIATHQFGSSLNYYQGQVTEDDFFPGVPLEWIGSGKFKLPAPENNQAVVNRYLLALMLYEEIIYVTVQYKMVDRIQLVWKKMGDQLFYVGWMVGVDFQTEPLFYRQGKLLMPEQAQDNQAGIWAIETTHTSPNSITVTVYQVPEQEVS